MSDLDLLRDGVLTVRGRLTEASNATLYCEAADPAAVTATAPARPSRISPTRPMTTTRTTMRTA